MTEHRRIRAIDSHTGGEPTRIVVDGFPELGTGTMSERLATFRRSHDHLRSAIVCEPRGHSAIVGALLCEPVDSASTAGVIYFNNVGYLGMCGHGTIGLIKTLEHMGRIGVGSHVIETAVGNVEAALNVDGSVTITNVASYRYAPGVEVETGSYGRVIGDIAYGGNWFFLIGEHPFKLELGSLEVLTDYASDVRNALAKNNITGLDGAEIDHIELFSPSISADSRNFVLCPGIEYDRSPCGTGTSAKLACLYSDGKLKAGEIWRQESIVGSVFEGQVFERDGQIIPVISGTAHITAELDLLLDYADPFCFGIGVK